MMIIYASETAKKNRMIIISNCTSENNKIIIMIISDCTSKNSKKHNDYLYFRNNKKYNDPKNNKKQNDDYLYLRNSKKHNDPKKQ
jgi:hypothetical protein